MKSTVEHFHRSTQANAKFFSIQKQMNSDSIPLKLKNDVVIRWNSTFYMFERIIKLKEPLTATIGLLHNPVELLSPLEWIALEESCQILRPFEQVSSEMSAEKTVTLSKVINIVRGLILVLSKFKENVTQPDCENLLTSLLQSMSSRFLNNSIELNSTAAKAALLDPRFKKRAFSCAEHLRRAKEKLQDEVVNLISKERQSLKSYSSQPNAVQSPIQDINTKEDLVWKEFDSQITTTLVQTPLSQAIIEIRMYMEDAPLDRKEDPLVYWKNRELLYPRLSKLVKKYLGIVATSVPSERIFSKAGELISSRRSRLKAKNVASLLFLNCNKDLLFK